MRRAVTSPKRGLLLSIAVLAALALGAPSGALAGAGLDISSTVSEPGGALVAQWKGIRRGMRLPKKPFGSLAVVPDVKGKPQAEAARLLKSKGLNPQVGGVVPTTDRTQAGKVASQVPEAGKTVPKGTKVALRVLIYTAPPGGGGPPPGWHPPGLGGGGRPSRVNTPGVIGMTKAQAEKVLTAAGLKSRVRGLVVTGDQSKGGRVKFHQPPPGMPVLPGTTVALDVYKFDPQGPQTITVGPMTTTTTTTGQGSGPPKIKIIGPEFWNSFVGMKYRDAENKLRKEGYTVSLRRWWPVGSDVSKRDRVTKVHWSGGERVNLEVYKYDKDARMVPDVTRMNLGDAKKRLKAAGFNPGGSAWVYIRDENLHCRVQKSNPPAGAGLKKGETVYLNVWTTDPEVSKSPGHPATGYFIGSLIRGRKPCHF